MKKIIFYSVLFLVPGVFHAQQQAGKVNYLLTVEVKPGSVTTASVSEVSGAGNFSSTPATTISESYTPEIPQQKFEMLFGNNKMVWRELPKEQPFGMMSSAMAGTNSGGGGDADDILFCDFATSGRIVQKNVFDQQFLITEDSITRLKWILSEETKIILNHLCRKAIAQRIEKQTRPGMMDGRVEYAEVTDTANLVAWYTPEIPVSAGPEVQGELPGLMLELAITKNTIKMIYTATDLTSNVNLAQIKEPVKGKKVTRQEFKRDVDKMMKSMQRRRHGKNTVIISN
jgi:GLPGLI family protein